MKKRTEGTDHKKSKSLINRCFLTRGGSRRLLSMGVSALLFVSTFLASILQTETIVYADNGKTITGLCTGTIGNPTSGAGGWSYVYYGKYGGNSVKYRVLSKSTSDFGGKTMLLDCDSTIENKWFDGDSNVWADSEICTWLNGETAGNFYCDSFTAQEKAAVVASSKGAKSSSDGDGWAGILDLAPLGGEKIFLLDAVEATNTKYGYANTHNEDNTHQKSGTHTRWWLRSPSHDREGVAGYVLSTGQIDNGPVSGGSYGVSPAFNLNLSSVIFSSVISGKNYKLTVKDDKLGIMPGAIERDRTTITVPYKITGDNKDEATQVSVLIMDNEYEAGTVVTSGYTYLKLNVTTWGTDSKGTFTLPVAYADKTCGTDYYAYILAEDVNTGNATDYACTPVAITIPAASVPVTGVTVSPKEVELKPGASTKLTETVQPDNATNKEVWWTSDRESVATVEDDGTVTAVDEGEAIITVTTKDGGFEATCKVTVRKDAPVTKECTITFDPNGGRGEMDAQEALKNKAAKLNKNEYTRDGYSFKEWNTKADGSGDSFKDEASVTPSGDMTLYAQWEEEGNKKIKGDGVTVEKSPKTMQILNDSLSDELRQKVDDAIAAGKEVDFVFVSKDKDESAPGAAEIKSYAKDKGLTMGKFFDLSLYVTVKGGDKLGDIIKTNGEVELEVSVPEKLRKNGRTFYVFKNHEGDISEVGHGQGDSVPISTDSFSTYALAYKDRKSAEKDDDDEDHTPPSWVLNPNEKQQLYIVYLGSPAGVCAGYQVQGEAAKALFTAATPVGWKEAFTFNLLNRSRMPEVNLKSGTLTLTVPAEYLKAGRQFAIIALDKNGMTYVLPDTDMNPRTVTVNVNFEGYAMELIYTD